MIQKNGNILSYPIRGEIEVDQQQSERRTKTEDLTSNKRFYSEGTFTTEGKVNSDYRNVHLRMNIKQY